MEISNGLSSSKYQSEFTGQYDSLAEIAEFVRKSAIEAGLDDFSVYSVETAVDEACSNIIEHAYKGKKNGIIKITCNVQPGVLVVVLQDHGKPFDPQKIPKPKLDTPLEKREDHGLGLYFIYQLMDEVHFNFNETSGNTLTMVKRKIIES